MNLLKEYNKTIELLKRGFETKEEAIKLRDELKALWLYVPKHSSVMHRVDRLNYWIAGYEACEKKLKLALANMSKPEDKSLDKVIDSLDSGLDSGRLDTGDSGIGPADEPQPACDNDDDDDY